MPRGEDLLKISALRVFIPNPALLLFYRLLMHEVAVNTEALKLVRVRGIQQHQGMHPFGLLPRVLEGQQSTDGMPNQHNLP